MTRATGSTLALVAVALSGCASSLSGLDATETYACKAPKGVTCMSVSGVYANSTHGSVRPAQPAPGSSPSDAPGIYGASSVAVAQPAAPGSASGAIRSSPRLLRVWIAPWQDSDGDLHEEGYVHMVVDTGRWLIGHVRPAPRSNVDGIVPPPASAAEAPPSKVPGEPLEPAPVEP